MTEQTLTEIRLYVGGLGEKVTEQEIKNTFSYLGNVKSVELIRTKGRSFAYINFFPSSTNALAKLYSTYNGCSWKGGKLKLEKAKEHYLDRLKREWAEEEELKNSELSHGELIKNSEPKIPSKLDLENMEFRLFFPKLRKLKPLSLTGTGKHKYSFRRLEGPPIPVHFCDCPEHSVPVQTRAIRTNVSDSKKGRVNKKEYNRTTPVTNKFIHRETSSDHRGIANHDSVIQDDGMNEEEINMIDSVMKKLLARGTSMRRDREILPFSQQKTGISEIEEVTNDDDDDDIKINVVSEQNYSLGLERHESLSNDETLPNEESNDIEDETDDGDHDIQINVVSRRKVSQTRINESIESSNKKRKSISIETDAEDTKSPINEKKSLLNIPLKKSPWKQLIADASNSSFTLSQITSENDVSHINQPNLGNKESSNVKKGKKVNQEDNKKKIRKSHKIAPEEPNLIDEPKAGSEEDEQENTKKSNMACDKAPAGSEEHEEENNFVQIENQSSKQNKKRKKTSKVQSEEVKPSNESPAGIEERDVDPPVTQPTGGSNKVTHGSSWFQKSTWTELVGGGANSSFSLSQILPGNLVQKQCSDKPDDFSTVSFTSTGAFSKWESSKDRTFDFGSFKSDLDAPSEEMEIRSSVPKPTPSYLARGVQISETCPFMKNDDSVKEWMAAKTAVKKSLKKLEKHVVNP